MNLMSSHLSSIKSRIVMVIIFMGVMLHSCQKEKLNIPGNVGTIRFAANSYTIENNTIDPLTIVLPLSLPLEQEGSAIVTVDASSTIGAGEYTITPAIPATGLTLNLAKGATEISFKVNSQNNFEGEKTLVLKLTSATGGLTVANTNATTTVLIKGNPIILPELKTSTSSLAFGNTITTTNSAAQSYTLTGIKLSANVTVTASTNFQVSLDNIAFSSTLTIPFATANAAPITLYARFRALTGINQTVSGTITHSSGAVADNLVTVSGVEYGVAAPGVLIKKEDLNYPTAGNLTAVTGGAWAAFSQSLVNPIQYITTGLTFSGYTGSGIGGALVTTNYTGNAEDATWSFPAQTSGVVYTSQMINFASAPTTADFFLSIGDGTTGTPTYYNRIYARANGGQMVIGLGRNSATATYSTTNLDYGTTYLLVHKYEFTTGTSSLYVLSGAPSVIEPPTPNAISATAGADPTSLTRVVIRQSTNLPLKATIDGIRIATSWKEAVGL